MWKRFLADYLNFTKKERTGIIVLLFLIVFFITIPFLFPLFVHPKSADFSSFKKQIDKLAIQQLDSTNKYSRKNLDEDGYQNYPQPEEKKEYSKRPVGELFSFDPNTLDEAGWIRLGLREKTIKTIQNFIAKGGRFYKPTDIGKIWGLREDESQRLIPYIQIQNSKTIVNDPEKKLYERKGNSIIDINSADTNVLIALPGIGSKLSQRIISFRDKLGGFYSVEQIGETYSLPDSTFQKLKPRFSVGNATVQQININTATVDEMKIHPYLRYAIANAIVQYRVQHGNYLTVSDVKKIMLVTDDIFNKAAPYLKVN